MSTVDDLCRSYLDLKWHFNPADASGDGVAALDHRLGSFDPEAMRAHLAAFRSLEGAIEELEPPDLASEIDRTALLDDLRTLVFAFEHERPHIRNPGFWLTHLFEGIYTLLVREGPLAERAPAALDRLKEAPAFLDQARATLAEPPLVFVDAALAALGGGGVLIGQAVSTLSAAAPSLGEDLEGAGREALEALTAFGRALGQEIAPSSDPRAFAVGEDQFERRLHHEHAIRGGAPELWRYGMHLIEDTQARLEETARRLGGTGDWRAQLERLRESALAGDVLSAYQAEAGRSRRFIEERSLVPGTAVPLDIVPTPSFLESLVPFAAYQPPPVELGGPARFFVTEVDDNGNGTQCIHEIASIVVHEAYPGHHIQVTASQSLQSEVRRHVRTPVSVEGWALYAENLMYEAGYFDTPEAELFHLSDLLWRAVRIIVDVGLHTRDMTPAEAVDRMTALLPMERRKAEAEVRRYCAMPTYQLAYAVGRRELLSLRDDWRRRAGTGAPLVDFHRALFGYGGLPVALARWGMGLDE
jgi:hypothetical protein